MQRAVILAAGDVVEVDALHLAAIRVDPAAGQSPAATVPAATTVLPAETQKGDKMREVEREHILDTLASAGGSRKLAGERLGMPERTLRYKLRQYRLDGFLKG